MGMKVSSLAGWMVGVSLALATFATAEPVAVRFPETPGNRALVLRSLDGKILAQGSVTVTVRDGRATSQVVFHFTDGSVQDETTEFSQNDVFRLLSYRLVQKGPAFPRTLVMTLDTKTGRAIVRHSEGSGAEEVEEETLTLSSDVANGLMVPVLKNLGPTTVSVDCFVGRCHAETSPSEAGNLERGRGAVSERSLQSPRHPLRRQSRDWGPGRTAGTARRQATARHARLDSRGCRSGVRKV